MIWGLRDFFWVIFWCVLGGSVSSYIIWTHFNHIKEQSSKLLYFFSYDFSLLFGYISIHSPLSVSFKIYLDIFHLYLGIFNRLFRINPLYVINSIIHILNLFTLAYLPLKFNFNLKRFSSYNKKHLKYFFVFLSF